MKKIAILLAIVTLLSVFSIGAAAAETVPTIHAEAVKKNDTVELTLKISEGSKIAGCSFNVVYDSSKLTYTGHEVKDTISSMMNAVNPEYNANAIRVLWADTKAMTKGGDVVKISFKIKDGATGSTEIVLDKLKMMDVSSNSVNCTGENPTIVITETKPGTGSTGTTQKPEEDPEVFLLGFDDVKETDWFYEGVKFVKEHQLMSGISETQFAPQSKLTRAMLVTILYRLEGEPACAAPKFSDVEKGKWYSNGIAWAAEKKVVNGMGDNQFAPNANITREQIAVILYNYSKLRAYNTAETKSLSAFRDAASVSGWAKKAVQWSVGAGLLSGKGEGILDPKGTATRAEIATILMRYVTKFVPSETET